MAQVARKPVTLVVDEFHTLPGADYEQVLGELAKYGANMLLATQTLSRLDRLTDAQRTRNLRASVFSNLDGLFAFHISAEDATYLAEELGGGLDAQDLSSSTCNPRWSASVVHVGRRNLRGGCVHEATRTGCSRHGCTRSRDIHSRRGSPWRMKPPPERARGRRIGPSGWARWVTRLTFRLPPCLQRPRWQASRRFSRAALMRGRPSRRRNGLSRSDRSRLSALPAYR